MSRCTDHVKTFDQCAYQTVSTFDAFMERLMCFYQTFDAFIKRSVETLELLDNSTSNVRCRI
jgi:hypothetical protein